MPSDRRAAIYFRRLAVRARSRAALLRQRARASDDTLDKTNLSAQADDEDRNARELDERATSLDMPEA